MQRKYFELDKCIIYSISTEELQNTSHNYISKKVKCLFHIHISSKTLLQMKNV